MPVPRRTPVADRTLVAEATEMASAPTPPDPLMARTVTRRRRRLPPVATLRVTVVAEVAKAAEDAEVAQVRAAEADVVARAVTTTRPSRVLLRMLRPTTPSVTTRVSGTLLMPLPASRAPLNVVAVAAVDVAETAMVATATVATAMEATAMVATVSTAITASTVSMVTDPLAMESAEVDAAVAEAVTVVALEEAIVGATPTPLWTASECEVRR